MQNREGQTVPNVVFRCREGGEWKDVSSHDVFSGKRVAVFALPGAFTPTCSASHLPRYEECAPELEKAGIDEIVCLSVNDGFVMEAWGKDQNVRCVRLLPDGNGEFTRQMGMLVDKANLGFGPRSWRYSMIVDDGVIEKMFIEPEVEGDPYEVSDADTMMAYLSPKTASRPAVTVFTRVGCPHCTRAKKMLDEFGLRFTEVEVTPHGGSELIRAIAGATTVPQVFIDGVRIGGADALAEYLNQERMAS
jgi:glutaredoxin-like protein